jgi:two-component system, NtrC family, response regulator HydG
MAGSFVSQGSDLHASLDARIEGLKFLAHHLDEPVVIFNPQMELVYANPSAERLADSCPLLYSPGEENSFVTPLQMEHCEPCPGKDVFRGIEEFSGSPLPSSTTSGSPSCPLPRAVPLRGTEGTVRFAVLMGPRGRESVVLGPKDMVQPLLTRKECGPVDRVAKKEIIGESVLIQRLVEMIQLVAASEATVLIQGESGTGKELVAKTIHFSSRRRERPFVVVECSALPETLLESELFGHVRGAFTGAVADRKGLFEEAEGGTIFLDEIADTSYAFQARLLRVLQEGEIKPVGSNRSVKVNVRVISAGNKSLEDLVATKLFRADLYYRLAVLPLTVPSLRDRREDIPLLVEHFLAQSAGKHGRASLHFSPDAQQALIQHPWPGNVRELENLIERVVVTCRDSTINVNDLFADPPSKHSTSDLSTIGKIARQEAERSRIHQALRDTKGDKTRAARILSISRSSLYNKLRDYKIS